MPRRLSTACSLRSRRRSARGTAAGSCGRERYVLITAQTYLHPYTTVPSIIPPIIGGEVAHGGDGVWACEEEIALDST